MFAKGTRVRCVNADFGPEVRIHFTQLPEAGAVYTVRGVFPARGAVRTPQGEEGAEIGVLLVEIQNPKDPFMPPERAGELGFNAERFEEVSSAS